MKGALWIACIALTTSIAASAMAQDFGGWHPVENWYQAKAEWFPFEFEEMVELHPGLEHNKYHGILHSIDVAKFYGRLSRVLGLPFSKSNDIHKNEVLKQAIIALFHDFNKRRQPHTTASVTETSQELSDDFYLRDPLLKSFIKRSKSGKITTRSVLRDRVGFNKDDLSEALAQIARTDFPPTEKTLKTYEDRLMDIENRQRREFVAQWAPILSLSDQVSGYYMNDFQRGIINTYGLLNEINKTAGSNVVDLQKLGSIGFLQGLGQPNFYYNDIDLAKRHGWSFTPLHIDFLHRLVPDEYRRNWYSNMAGYAKLQDELNRGQDLETAIAIASDAANGYLARERINLMGGTKSKIQRRTDSRINGRKPKRPYMPLVVRHHGKY